MTHGPIGEPVTGGPAARPERTTIGGQSVLLVPLEAKVHTPALFQETTNEELWLYMSDGPYADEAAFEAAMQKKAGSEDPLFYTVLDRPNRKAVGHLALMRIEPAHRVIEVGHVMFGTSLQRTRGATEAIYLTAKYVFDELGYRRFEWKCNSLNEPSRRAAIRFGFQFEGVFRQHFIIKGRNRDTAWFAMTDGDWPARKAAFERWLAPENFDAAGRQRVSLTDI